jgi:hypothetical protein
VVISRRIKMGRTVAHIGDVRSAYIILVETPTGNGEFRDGKVLY